jgi:two-component system, NarL family, response regulator YdfI
VTRFRETAPGQGRREPARRGIDTASTTVLVIAGSDRLAAAIEAMLRGHPEWRVVVGSPAQLAHVVDDLEPGSVVMALPPPAAASALQTLGSRPRVLPVILLAAEPLGAWTAQARRAGVRGVLRDDATAEELVAAVAATMAGLVVLHPAAVIARPVAGTGSRRVSEGTGLTPRELEILEMMAEGMSNRRIAVRLGISGYTVKFHVASVLGKLGAATRTEAVTLGVRQGLISL